MKLTILALALLILCVQPGRAESGAKLGEAALAEQTQCAALIAALLPLDHQTSETINRALGIALAEGSEPQVLVFNWYGQEPDLGFGGRKIRFRSPHSGSTTFFVNALTFEGKFGIYEVGLENDSDDWPQLRAGLLETWKRNGGPEVTETEHGFSAIAADGAVFQAFKKGVAAELGAIKPVDVPADLKPHYAYLMAPVTDTHVGSGGIGYAGLPVAGRVGIDALVRANRTDLIENVLRGYNPGGRVYAAQALLQMKSKGLPLSPETTDAIQKIAAAKTTIWTYAGCEIGEATAGEILRSARGL